MEKVLNYILESSVVLGVLIIMYKLMLKNLNNLNLNRIYIAVSMVFSAVLPLIHFKITANTMPNLLPGITFGEQRTNLLEAITIYTQKTNYLLYDTIKNLTWMQVVYIVGFSLLVVRLIYGLYHLRLFKNRASVEKQSGYILVNSNSDTEPFSFFGLLFINRVRYTDDEFKAIVNHELAHIQLKHTLDNLLLELILIIQWFNPFAWLLRRYLKEVQEYQADRFTIKSGTNPQFYKELLLSNAMGTRVALANNLNQLLIKKRLKMINNRINKSPGIIRLLAVSAVFVLLAIAFACERDDQNVYTEVDEMAEFPGGIPAVQEFIQKNLTYPKSAEENGIEGRVFVQFIVSKEGKVTQAKVVRSVSPELDEEALRVINLLPEWTPAKLDGKEVNVQFTIPINFKLMDNNYTAVEDMPQFNGGMHTLREYLRVNVRYPEEARDKNITGKAYVKFDVDKTGKVTNVQITESAGNEYLDKEAIRVVESLPDWKPGIQDGEAVTVSFTIPIVFSIVNGDGAIVINKTNVDKQKMNINVQVNQQDDFFIADGRISDGNNLPLKGAHVIVKGTTIGCTTDNAGNFSLKLPEKNSELVVSYVGKKTLYWQNIH